MKLRSTRDLSSWLVELVGKAVSKLSKHAQEGLKECPGHLQTPHQPHFTTGYAKGN